jgi:two-component system, NarL family, invasion response regulator UvrY
MIRILLADDNEVLRWGLVQNLSSEPDLVVVGEADEAGAAVAEFDRLAPDVLILDLYMPGGGGWVALEQVLARHPEARVVILSAADDVTTVEAAILRGAKAHVSKSDGITRLLQVLRSVASAVPPDVGVSASSADRAGGPQAPSSAGGGDPGTR